LSCRPAAAAGAVAAACQPAPRSKVSLRGKVEFVFDPTRYDGATRESEIPVRLRNVSSEPIYTPITLESSASG
jgi:hypothetical protein